MAQTYKSRRRPTHNRVRSVAFFRVGIWGPPILALAGVISGATGIVAYSQGYASGSGYDWPLGILFDAHVVRDTALTGIALLWLIVDLVVVGLIRVGYRYEWTGFGETAHPKSETHEIQPRKTLWDWFSLLIVPIVLSLIAIGFTLLQDFRQRAIEDQRAQEEALQAYQDQMSALLLEKDLRGSNAQSEVRRLARARTLTILERLDPEHKRRVVGFLYEAILIQDEWRAHSAGVVTDLPQEAVIDMDGADLHEADLSGAYLENADLSGAILAAADLSEARGWTKQQLTAARDLTDATMPNCQKYNKDWLKSKGSGEDGENRCPS